MPDKYDEAIETLLLGDNALISCVGDGSVCFNREKVYTFLRTAFPPPAEDARMLVKSLRTIKRWDATSLRCRFTKSNNEAAAEIESFAQSRVEQWREALGNLLDAIEDDVSGTPMSKRLASTAAVARQARALLSDSPAKEAAKEHGKTCRKEPHVRDGYLHGEDDDTPYYVDNIKYCGRCHMTI